jgi:imidazolonepropionase-like amidohydrolase
MGDRNLVGLLTALILISWLPAAPVGSQEEADGRPTAILCDLLIDGLSDEPRHDTAVIVEGERIVAVAGREAVPQGARIVDLGDATLMPGLIDAHSHPLLDSDDYQYRHLSRSSAYKALRGLKAVQATLAAGWTTLRIAGDGDVHYAHLELRRAIDEGLWTGPRIAGAGHYISNTGGGGDINFLSPEQRVIADGLVVDGVDAMRRAVREEIKFGSDWIKLLVTGAFMSAADNPRDVHFSREEVEVAVEEANRRGIPVMAHAHAADGIRLAIESGVRSIEHGTFIDEEGVRMAAEAGVYLVPTLYIGDYFIEKGSDGDWQDKNVELSKRYRDEHYQRVGMAIRGGVKVVVGVDLGGLAYPAEKNVRELAALVEAGMTPMQAIQAVTRVNAELLGWEDRIGTVEPGKLADLVAVPGNPLDDMSVLERVSFVMLGGEVVKGE